MTANMDVSENANISLEMEWNDKFYYNRTCNAWINYREINTSLLTDLNSTLCHNYSTKQASYVNESTVCIGDGFQIYFHLVPVDSFIVYVQFSLAVLIVIMNSILIFILIKRVKLTVTNIFLSFLGFSDACCAVLATFPFCFGYMMGSIPVSDNSKEALPGLAYVPLEYPFCIEFDWTFVSLSDLFHYISIWITAALGCVKAIALMFPIKSRIYIKSKMATVCCLLITFVSFGVYLPFSFSKSFVKGQNDVCCSKEVLLMSLYSKIFDWIIILTYIITFLTLIISTIYIATILTVRSRIRKTENRKMQQRNNRSAIIVIMIVVDFISTEAITAVCYISEPFIDDYRLCLSGFFQYQQLIMLLGFASNFITYWIMSQELRSHVYNCVSSCFCHQRRRIDMSASAASTQTTHM